MIRLQLAFVVALTLIAGRPTAHAQSAVSIELSETEINDALATLCATRSINFGQWHQTPSSILAFYVNVDSATFHVLAASGGTSHVRLDLTVSGKGKADATNVIGITVGFSAAASFTGDVVRTGTPATGYKLEFKITSLNLSVSGVPILDDIFTWVATLVLDYYLPRVELNVGTNMFPFTFSAQPALAPSVAGAPLVLGYTAADLDSAPPVCPANCTCSTGEPICQPVTMYPITYTKAGTGWGQVTSSPAGLSCTDSCTVSFGGGTVVTFTAVPSPGSTFAGWTGACTGMATTCTVTINAATAVGATFSSPPVDDAVFVSQNTVTSGTAGTWWSTQVTLRNTGNTTWTTAAGYALGSQNPANNTIWGASRVALPGNIAPGQLATFNVSTGQALAGAYNFQWQLVHGSMYFGALSPNVVITFVDPPPNLCGDGVCSGGETCCSCSTDCGAPVGWTCFAAGTPISVVGGARAIENIREGDVVLAYDPAGGQVVESTVVSTFAHADAGGTVVINGKIEVTPNHPFWVNGEWRQAGELAVGDRLLELGASSGAVAMSASPVMVTRLESRGGPGQVYNLEVADFHNYFAGGFLVHNKSQQCDPAVHCKGDL